MNVLPLRLVALEITRTCNLACKHCRGDSHDISYPDELTLDEIRAILNNIASFSRPIIIITGGEPLTRPTVFEISAYSTSLKLRTVLATCGHLLNDETVRKLQNSGVLRISVSLDGVSPETHDNFRGVQGAFKAALKGLEVAKKYGLDFQINSTLTTLNIGELEDIHDLAVNLGAVGFHPFLLVPMGRGKGLFDFALSCKDYETALIRIAEIAANSPIEIKPTCSPHYNRVIQQMPSGSSGQTEVLKASVKHSQSSALYSHPADCDNNSRQIMTKGCLGGEGFVFISHTGKVQTCGFLEIEAGDLRTNGYNLKDIWEMSEFFREIRDMDHYHGKCGICEYRFVCGGCRARAYYINGDYLGEEPSCIYIPKRNQT